jgi:hypothetical protein
MSRRAYDTVDKAELLRPRETRAGDFVRTSATSTERRLDQTRASARSGHAVCRRPCQLRKFCICCRTEHPCGKSNPFDRQQTTLAPTKLWLAVASPSLEPELPCLTFGQQGVSFVTAPNLIAIAVLARLFVSEIPCTTVLRSVGVERFTRIFPAIHELCTTLWAVWMRRGETGAAGFAVCSLQ